MSFEQEPRQYNFDWQWDHEPYLGVKTEYGELELRPSTTVLFLYPEDPEIDHIYIMKQMNPDGTSLGYRLFREHCDRVGEGAFSAIVDQLVDNGFEMSEDEEPEQCDITAWEKAFERTYERPNSIDKVVDLAMKHFDSEAEYYLGHEWA